MDAPRCGDCRFYKAGAEFIAGTRVAGECRRNAPTIGSEWPWLYDDQWCGEYVAREGGETVEEFIKARIALCGHGTISATCGPCVAAWLPR